MEINSEIKGELGLSDEYFDVTVDAAEREENFNISNSTIDHAIFLTYLLIKKARKSIKIFSGDLDSNCYDNRFIRTALSEAIKGKKKVKVEAVIKEGKNMARIFKELKVIVKKLHKGLNGIPLDNHFMVVDNKFYRIEAKHKGNLKNVNAKANFNNSQIAIPLTNFFNLLLKNSS